MRKILKNLTALPKFLWKRKLLSFVILLIVLGSGFYFYRQKNKKNGFEKDVVKKGDVVEELILSGEIDATEHANLSFETSGKLVYVGVSQGDVVKKGQILGKLDTTTLNSAYQGALADLRKYEATVENIHDEVKDHSGDETYSQKDTRTTAEVNKDKAYEAVVIAERNLKGATLSSPFAGIVTYVANPFSGPFVLSTQKQFEVVNPNTIYFSVSADQTEVTKLHEGQDVRIVLDSFPDLEIKGTITEISFSPDAGEVGVVYKIKVSLENIENVDYRLGMTGDAKFTLNTSENVLYVPTKFVKNDKQGSYLLIDDGSKKVYVETGIEGEETTEIKGNIHEGKVIYD